MDLWYQKQLLSQLPNQKYFALTKDIVLFLINNIGKVRLLWSNRKE